ncbi:DUF3349 domain-containing protein [Mycobacterium triplex]|uniref:DUF3349 domain-containing protein n=1 Tax=Mycobacterium triplex TaxID=47839 RepID=A0A024K0K4_9MYCO|nr:DUF3349 domain-containing protein [Mycobacterium triplex]CDO89585.1 hypothetical protein BN973_03964 [Mycobacterium triplex]
MTAGGWCGPVPLSGLVTTFDTVIRAGYPQGVPRADYVPLLALLRRRMPDHAVAAVATHVATRGALDITAADIRAAITRVADELPCAADLERVQGRLAAIIELAQKPA